MDVVSTTLRSENGERSSGTAEPLCHHDVQYQRRKISIKIFNLPYLSLFLYAIIFNIIHIDSLLYSQEQNGVIAGSFLENSEPCSLQINLHNGESKLYFGKNESGKNGYYAFSNLLFGSYYLITHPAGVGIRMPLQWRSENVEITHENPVYIMPAVDCFSVEILHPTDVTQIDYKKISNKNPLVFKWTPYNGSAEYEVEIYSTDSSQVLKSERISKINFSFNGKFEDGSSMKKRLYRWSLNVYPIGINWSGKSKPQDIIISDLGQIKKYRGKYIELEFPKWYEPTIKKLDLLEVLDKCYLLQKELAAGQVPTLGPLPGEKQSFLYDPNITFAHSGNPIHFGKTLINEGSFPFFITLHEMAHNFQFGGLPGFAYLLGNEYYDKTTIYFGFSEGFATLASLYITESLTKEDVNSQVFELLQKENKKMRRNYPKALQLYEKNGADKERITPNTIDGICIRIGDKYGWQIFPKFFRIFLKNEITDKIYKLAGSNDSKRITIIVAALSAASGDDLCSQFKKWDFPLDEDFYMAIRPMVEKCIYKN